MEALFRRLNGGDEVGEERGFFAAEVKCEAAAAEGLLLHLLHLLLGFLNHFEGVESLCMRGEREGANECEGGESAEGAAQEEVEERENEKCRGKDDGAAEPSVAEDGAADLTPDGEFDERVRGAAGEGGDDAAFDFGRLADLPFEARIDFECVLPVAGEGGEAGFVEFCRGEVERGEGVGGGRGAGFAPGEVEVGVGCFEGGDKGRRFGERDFIVFRHTRDDDVGRFLGVDRDGVGGNAAREACPVEVSEVERGEVEDAVAHGAHAIGQAAADGGAAVGVLIGVRLGRGIVNFPVGTRDGFGEGWRMERGKICRAEEVDVEDKRVADFDVVGIEESA